MAMMTTAKMAVALETKTLIFRGGAVGLSVAVQISAAFDGEVRMMRSVAAMA